MLGSERNNRSSRYDKLAILETLLIFLTLKIEQWMETCGKKFHEKGKSEELSNGEESEVDAKVHRKSKKGLAVIDSDEYEST